MSLALINLRSACSTTLIPSMGSRQNCRKTRPTRFGAKLGITGGNTAAHYLFDNVFGKVQIDDDDLFI